MKKVLHRLIIAAALKFFRSCIGLQDEAYNTHFIQHNHFTPILNIVYTTMPRDNLLNSACLELFEVIHQQSIRPIIEHLVLVHRSRLEQLTYVDTFKDILHRWDRMNQPPPVVNQDMTLFSNDGDGIRTPERRGNVNGNRWHGMKEMDAAEQAYFDTSDDEEDDPASPVSKKAKLAVAPMTNGLAPSPMIKSLVDYPDDDDDAMESLPSYQSEKTTTTTIAYPHQRKLSPSPMLQTPPPERLSEKRRREADDDDEDELGKLSTVSKRRISGPFSSSPRGEGGGSGGGGGGGGAGSNHGSPAINTLRRKMGFLTSSSKDNNVPQPHPDTNTAPAITATTTTTSGEPKKKIAISLSSAVKTPPAASPDPESKQDDDGGGGGS